MISKIFKICNAYESGVGHGSRLDGKNIPPYQDPGCNEAYQIGYSAGTDMVDIRLVQKEPACEKCGRPLCFSGTGPSSPLCKTCEAKLLYGVSDKKRRFIRRKK